MKKTNFLTSLFLLAVPTFVGTLSSQFSSMGQGVVTPYPNQPPLVPPASVFPVVWTILYALMGIALYLVVNADYDKKGKKIAVSLFAMQLLFNFLWPIVFFRLEMCGLALVINCILLFLILLTIIVFGRIKKVAGYLLIPYLIWVAFAVYLNLGFCILN